MAKTVDSAQTLIEMTLNLPPEKTGGRLAGLTASRDSKV
jgi:hypothetical protein